VTQAVHCQMKPYIQPFERRLAAAELCALAGQRDPGKLWQQSEHGDDLEVTTVVAPTNLADRLSYYEKVRSSDRDLLTTQVLREATVYVARNGTPLAEIKRHILAPEDSSLPNRRCLRYGTHGIHEYRGKFFPQLVRALINVAGVPQEGVVADPMCGSGTSLVEAQLAGCTGLGMDMNPLSLFISRVKCSLLSVDADTLVRRYKSVRRALLESRPKTSSRRLQYFKALPAKDREYLERWFSADVLEDLDAVVQAVGKVQEETVRDFMKVALSNILREVSWQKKDDLRVRREVRTDVKADPIREFLEELGRSVRLVAAFLYQNQDSRPGQAIVTGGDARALEREWSAWQGKVDAVITSPPYATALPYLDTDRLSLSYLGLLPRPSQRQRDLLMIGNREITEKIRRAYWERLQTDANLLPKQVVKLIHRIHRLNSGAEVGFRRRNLPALLAKYFFDMREVLAGIKKMLRPGASAFVVVGNNHTKAGGKHVDIKTAELLAETGRLVGFEEGRHIPMEMLVSRDIFRKNAVASETILELKKPR